MLIICKTETRRVEQEVEILINYTVNMGIYLMKQTHIVIREEILKRVIGYVGPVRV